MPEDMAVLFAYFNPCNSKRILMNYLYCVNKIRCEGYPTFTIELLFNKQSPAISDAVHVRSKSYMFYKENLYRILEKFVPVDYTKLAFLDADVIFSKDDWYRISSNLLDECDVVQPFETAEWLNIAFNKTLVRKRSALLYSDYIPGTNFADKHHPGFAWCMRRDWYNKVGFFDKAVAGGGDLLSTTAWLGISMESSEFLLNFFKNEYLDFIQKPKPRITYLPNMKISHLFHGSLHKRQYDSRIKLINSDVCFDDIITQNSDGLYEWIDIDKYNPLFFRYFKNRDDDGV